MRSRFVAGSILLGLVLVGCTNGPNGSPPATPVSPNTSSPSAAPIGDIKFVLDDTYTVGDRVVVKIENVGRKPYLYQATYPACFLTFLDADGREFLIPPGTHCDILGEAAIRPGETRRLFVWELDECVRDEWGCVKERPLTPGTYTMRGTFEALKRGTRAHAEITFDVVAIP
jgi:hypothetical protein